MSDSFAPILQEVDFLVAERKEIAAAGPHFKIIHRFHESGTDCCAGEEITSASLVCRSREYVLRLSPKLLMLFDYLARHRHIPQSAAHIVSGMQRSTFYTKHGANARVAVQRSGRLTFRTVKVYIQRLRDAFQIVFGEANLNIDPFLVLVSEATDTNCTLYRLKATAEWVHLP